MLRIYWYYNIGYVHAYIVQKVYNPADNTANQKQSVAGSHVKHSLMWWLNLQQLQDTCAQ